MTWFTVMEYLFHKDTKEAIRIREEQTTQWPKDTKEAIRIREEQTTQWPKEKEQKDK
jgi:hypothetical protein